MTAGALLAAALSLPAATTASAAPATTPAAAAAPQDDTASPTPSDSPPDTPTPSDSPAPSDTPTPTASDSPAPTDTPSDTPSDSPTPTASDSPAPADSVSGIANYTGDYWKLALNAYAPAGITDVTAHFTPAGSPAGTPDAGTESLQADPGGWPVNYVSASDVQLPAVGVYDVSVDVTDQNGVVEHFADAGQFTYAAQVSVGKLSADRSTIDYDHRTVNLSAPVTVTDPSTGSALDPTGVQVALDYYNGSAMVSVDGTVGAGGQLAVAAQPGASTTFWTDSATGSTAAYPYHITTADQNGAAVTLNRDATRIRLTGSTDVKVAAGGRGTLRGVVEREVGGAWIATPNETLDVMSDTGQCPNATVKTGADGTFSFTTGCGDQYAFQNFEHSDPLLQGMYPGPSGWIHIPKPTSITPFTVTEDEYGMATVTGTVVTNNWTTGAKGYPVEIEFSYDDKTWHDAGTIKVGDGNSIDEFQAYGTYATWANGYWRAKYLGSPDDQPSWSTSVKVWKTPTRVTGGTPNHTTVNKNQYVYFSGHVQQRNTKNVWGPVKYSWVDLVFRPYGSKTWYYVSHVKTSSTGAYSLHGKAVEGGTWSVAWFTKSGAQVDSNGPMTYVHVR